MQFRKKLYKTPLFFIIFLIFGCNNKTDNIDENNNLTQKEKIKNFLENLKEIDTNVNKVETKTRDIYSYPLEILVDDISTLTRYANDDVGDLIIREGTQSYPDNTSTSLGSSSNAISYTTQKYHDDNNFYSLTLWNDDEETKSKKTTTYDSLENEFYFSLSFYYEEFQLLEELMQYCDNSLYKIEINLLDDFVDGKNSYSYSITTFEEEDSEVIKEKYSYSRVIDIENNKIQSLHHEMNAEYYLGGTLVNSLNETSDRDYFYGEYQNYNGTIYNQKDFIESNV